MTSTTVAWPLSDFFQNFPKSLETSKKRCLTVVRRSRDLRPLSRDRSATFFENFYYCLKRPKNVVWQSADGSVTSDHCRVTVPRLFQNSPKLLETSINVVWQSADGRVTSDHCRVTVQRLFSKFSQIAWNVQKTLFDSRPTVAWPPTTVAWPFSDSFQKKFKLLETSKNRCLTVGLQSRDLRTLSSDRSATFFKKFPNCLKRPKNVVWQSADGRVTSDHCRVTVQRLYFKISPNCLKRTKSVVWQSADGRVTSDHCRVTVQRLFSKFHLIAWIVQKTLFNSRQTVAWPPTTVAWPFSDFFQKVSKLLETSKKRCLTIGRRSRDLRQLSRDRSVSFFQNFT